MAVVGVLLNAKSATLRVTVVECTSAPEVPVIVTVLLAIGVEADVLTVRVEVAALTVGVGAAGENEQVTDAGNPEHESVTALENPFAGCTVRL